MNIKEYINLIKEKREEIILALEKGFCNSLDNRNLEFNVELCNDGNILEWYSNAGSGDFKKSNLSGDSIHVATFCNQYILIDNAINETEEEWLEWYKDEYKNSEAINKLDYIIEQLEINQK